MSAAVTVRCPRCSQEAVVLYLPADQPMLGLTGAPSGIFFACGRCGKIGTTLDHLTGEEAQR